VLVVALPVALLCFLMGRAREEGKLISCRNHATFVGKALDAHVLKHGQLPCVPGIPGEDLFCRIDFHGDSQNCHAGAQGQRHGGWQMVNASPKSWGRILRMMKGSRIPVIWCGRVHRSAGGRGDRVRVVIAFGVYDPAPASVAELIATKAETDPSGTRSLYYFITSIVYHMPEEELKARLAEINAILRKNGEPETPLDVEGREDYWKLAEPYQTIPKP